MAFFFFKQKTAYEMRISDWSSDVCSSDLGIPGARAHSGAADEPGDLLVRDRPGAVEDRHPAIKHVECQMLRPPELGSDNLVEYCHLLGAVEPSDPEAATRCRRPVDRRGATAG